MRGQVTYTFHCEDPPYWAMSSFCAQPIHVLTYSRSSDHWAALVMVRDDGSFFCYWIHTGFLKKMKIFFSAQKNTIFFPEIFAAAESMRAR